MSSAVEGDVLRDTRLHAPFAQREIVPGGVFQPREDPFVGPAARPHVAHGLLGDVEVLQTAGLLLAEDHARAAVELLHLAPRQLVDVAPAHARQTREDEGILQHRVGAVGLDQPLQFLNREVFAVHVFGSRGLDPHGGRLGDDPLLDGPVQCRLEFQKVAVLAVGREGGAALRAGLLGEVGAEPLDEPSVDPFEGGLRPRIGDQVFQHAVPVAPVAGRILALLDHPADKLDQVGADLERHGEPVLLVLLGEQPFGLDLLGHLQVDLVVVALGLVAGCGVEEVFEGLEFALGPCGAVGPEGVPQVVFQYQRGSPVLQFAFDKLNLHRRAFRLVCCKNRDKICNMQVQTLQIRCKNAPRGEILGVRKFFFESL